MKKIKSSEWKKMTNKDKANFLLSGEFYTKKLMGIPENSKAGDHTVLQRYIGYVAGIGITEPCDSLVECLEESALCLKSWKAELTK